jgi:hypothetical protein
MTEEIKKGKWSEPEICKKNIERTPDGFTFRWNTDNNEDNVRLQRYRKNPDKFIIFPEAYDFFGNVIPGLLAVYERIETEEKKVA